jgi:hypothetical protein
MVDLNEVEVLMHQLLKSLKYFNLLGSATDRGETAAEPI